jgi:hypothetical protein
MSRARAFILGALTGAAALIALTWAYVAYDARTPDHPKPAR